MNLGTKYSCKNLNKQASGSIHSYRENTVRLREFRVMNGLQELRELRFHCLLIKYHQLAEYLEMGLLVIYYIKRKLIAAKGLKSGRSNEDRSHNSVIIDLTRRAR